MIQKIIRFAVSINNGILNMGKSIVFNKEMR